ncbi:MAG TPA: GC-type dockerin domain-anchored protein [Phycisphaerales bacterium]|nr:GC-type dockerin domain-anchored protein [Phycisphaerales bacterium]
MFNLRMYIAGSIMVCALAAHAQGQVTFYNVRSTWVNGVGGARNVAEWKLLPQVLDAALEYAGPTPVINTDLGPVLTFDVPVRFSLACLQPSATFIYRDSAFGAVPETMVSIGKGNLQEDDDFAVTFPGDSCISAAGITLYDNSAESGEFVRVYDKNNNLIGAQTGLSGFVGIRSTVPIGRIEIDENAGGDDIGVLGVDVVLCNAPAPVRAVGGQADWRLDADRLGTIEGLGSRTFQVTASTLVDADEVAAPPANNQQLGPTLTLSSFSPPFRLSTLEPGAAWTFNDTLFSATGFPMLSVGKADVHDDDDFELALLGCASAVGITVLDSTDIADEYILIYAANNALLGMTAPFSTAADGQAFIGLVAPGPIDRVVYFEDPGADDIALKDISIIDQLAVSPAAAITCRGGNASFSLAASVDVSQPRWRRDGQSLVDGPTPWGSVISGAQTTNLVIAGVTANDAGSYECVADTACGNSVAASGQLQLCISDFDCTGFVDIDDYTSFVFEFELGNDAADVDGTGFVDIDDFVFFVQAFEAGC